MSDDTLAAKPEYDIVTVPGGKTIKLRPPKGSDHNLCTDLAGQNMGLYSTFQALCRVVEIDGVPQSAPRTRNMLDAVADALGLDGVEAVMESHSRRTQPELVQAMDELGPAATPQLVSARVFELRAAKLKNS